MAYNKRAFRSPQSKTSDIPLREPASAATAPVQSASSWFKRAVITPRAALQALFFIILIAGSVLAWRFSSEAYRQADGMTRYIRVDTWAVQKVEYELNTLEGLLARHVAGDATIPIRHVRKQLAAARATVPLLRGGDNYEQFNMLVDIDGVADAVVDALNKAETLLTGRADLHHDLGSLHSIEGLLSKPAFRLRQLAIDVAHVQAELQDGDINNVRWLTGINRWILIGFLGAAALFIVFLFAEARRARRSEVRAKQNEERARYVAEHDILTSLPNRMMLQKRLNENTERARNKNNRLITLYMLDLDLFKDINETFGYAAGDELLVAVATRLTAVDARCRPFRVGGDEFAIIQDLPGPSAETETYARQLLDTFARPFVFRGREIVLNACIGAASFPQDASDASELIKAADLALRQTKQHGQGGIQRFDAEMMVQRQTRKQLEDDLQNALYRNELELHFQPQVALDDGRCIGAEALIRWRHPERGWISPVEFIPLAEETGAIHSIGRWIMETACQSALCWQGVDDDSVVAVNVSPAQFVYGDLVAQVRAILARTKLPPHRLELEITEGQLMRDVDAAIKTLDQLENLGVRLAIDDFGTGYSSLSYLKRFHVHKLKIDRSFVIDMETDANDRTIVRTIIALAESLGMKTIAEGIETPAQEALLAELGCGEGQGYYYGKPMPAAEFNAWTIARETPSPEIRLVAHGS